MEKVGGDRDKVRVVEASERARGKSTRRVVVKIHR